MQAKQIEEKWQKKWEEANLYQYHEDPEKQKFYVMEMFSYPSGANLHVGHWYNLCPLQADAGLQCVPPHGI